MILVRVHLDIKGDSLFIGHSVLFCLKSLFTKTRHRILSILFSIVIVPDFFIFVVLSAWRVFVCRSQQYYRYPSPFVSTFNEICSQSKV